MGIGLAGNVIETTIHILFYPKSLSIIVVFPMPTFKTQMDHVYHLALLKHLQIQLKEKKDYPRLKTKQTGKSPISDKK